MNKIKFLILIISLHSIDIYPAITVDGLKKLITKFADEDKSYITLYAAELGLDYDKYLTVRRKQNCLEIKNYVSMFSPTLTGDALAGKIDQDKLEWVNNICPNILPKVPLTTTVTLANDNAAQTKPTESNATPPPAAATTNVTAPAPITNLNNKNKSFNSFHALNNN